MIVTIYKWLSESNTSSPVICVASHIKSTSFVQLSWGMSYAGTVICEISHFMLIALSPIASQHRFHNEMHDFCIVSERVKKIDLALEVYLKTPMSVWKEISTGLYLSSLSKGAYFLFVTVQHLLLWRLIQW